MATAGDDGLITITAATPPGNKFTQLFYRGSDFGAFSRWDKEGDTWSGEQTIGGLITSDIVAAVPRGTEVLQLFYRGLNSAAYTRWRQSDGSWSAEHKIGGVISSDIAVASPPSPP